MSNSTDTVGTTNNFSLFYIHVENVWHISFFFLIHCVYFALTFYGSLDLSVNITWINGNMKGNVPFVIFIKKKSPPPPKKKGRIQAGQGQRSSIFRRMLSPLMFGHNVSSVHYCHARPGQLLWRDFWVKFSHHRAVIWCHAAPWPVVWNPGVG